ncbi:MAG: NUDIX domain-containing protein [Thermomicrobium sp.]|nr:NUDIX domain-containing protein [Thermomicrobium sp.]
MERRPPDRTTDPQDELFDVLTPTGDVTGRTATRRDVHRAGLWHAAFHLWVVWREGDDLVVLLQRRSRTKDTMPGRIDVSVGGHLRAGEYDPERLRSGRDLEPILREMREELGTSIDPRTIQWVGRRRTESIVGRTVDREMQELFVAVQSEPPRELTPDPREVEALVTVSVPALVALLQRSQSSIPARILLGGDRTGTTWIDEADLVPSRRDYWLAMLDLVHRAVSGERFEPLFLHDRSTGL